MQANISLSDIAKILGCHKSTVSREIKRNRGQRGYRPKQAHRLATECKAINSPAINDFGWHYVDYLLHRQYSPEQITGRLKLLGWDDVPSHETIYQYIYADKQSGGELYKHLRCQKTYRKRALQGQDRRGQIVNRRDITERPDIIEECTRIGDYEGGTVVGKGHQGVLLTLVDRTTRETKIKALSNRKAQLVADTCIDMLKGEQTLSTTFDNSKEFAKHDIIADTLDTDIYFFGCVVLRC
ncbi:IS30 family transposase [Suttonella sp. R2A3]|uniref:IS30 family transposase n=1 Tax=Suttonella sp. R2A3 TaxID=2908648 RepID=UPI001F395C95|nr:IS30 family transposase [Suttonella sp. R2A3]